ncbi:MAG: serine/threonine-protein kinase [Phycisphaerae bacterium]
MTMQETMTILLRTQQETAPQSLVVPRRVGHVKIGEVLGEGTGGVVLSGFDEALGRRVAVKVLHAPTHAGAVNELVEGIRTAARIKHPNVITVYAVETFERLPLIVMELVDGVSLRDLLRRGGRLELPLALFVMRDINAGVSALHASNVVHRDLKPANILFDRGGAAHVCDFGLACEFDAARLRGRISAVGGSPLYMAPEMFDGEVSPHSDVYALGVILFELLCGQPPYSGDSIQQMRTAHHEMPIPTHLLERAGVPEPLREVIERALHKQKFLRFKSALHLQRALEQVDRPAVREELLRSRVAEIVNTAPRDAAPSRDPAERTPASQTTYDLLAERARTKREEKDRRRR